MNRSSGLFRFACCTLLALSVSGQALAWGASGHRLIGRVAVGALPRELPAFMRSVAAVEAVGELAREPDRWKDAGRLHDADRDAAHFLNLEDDGRVFGKLSLNALPPTRQEYESVLRFAGGDSWRAGYLPYAIIDGVQQLAIDMAYWRADLAGAAKTKEPGHRAWLEADRKARESLILRDLGVLAHYVGDGSQPLHLTRHYNGWGPGPNPKGYTTSRIHGPFEGALVRRSVSEGMVVAGLAPASAVGPDLMTWTCGYLADAAGRVDELYALEKAGGLAVGDPRGAAYAAARLAAAASALRDLTTYAWSASAGMKVGWAPVSVADVEAGRIDPYDALRGND